MIRRRRPVREIPFSFDSFLDIVANVLGIIIRLILVVWVGARSYSTLLESEESAPAATAQVAEQPLPSDPLEDELASYRRQLAQAQKALLTQLRELQETEASQNDVKAHLTALTADRQQLESGKAQLASALDDRERQKSQAELSMNELRKRCKDLVAQIKELEKQPLPKKTLRYRTPVSQPLHSEELFFECAHGRVTFIDVQAMLLDIRDTLPDKGKELRTLWETQGETRPVGAFRLRYTVERERGVIDTIGAATPSNGNYSYGVTAWEVQPVIFDRGETLEQALRPSSQFRHVVDALDPQFTAVTFWVTPDSFGLFRSLRDFLYQKDLVVAGRPLPEGVPIASSRRGSASRGQ